MSVESLARQRFLEEYRHIRHAEGRGSRDNAYYRALPFRDLSGVNSAMWAMRAKTYSYFENKILRRLETSKKQPLDVLDLGAGNCWLSHRLTLRGHRPVAVDIFSDALDGLRAADHYPSIFPTVEADFSEMPLRSAAFDLAVFNASFHYSTHYVQTLSEVRRCLRPSGSIVILDSPMYRMKEHGLRMVEEKHAEFLTRYGFRSDALPSVEFLDLATLEVLRRTLKIHWKISKPWYGLSWHLRPLRAWIEKRRPPSRFWILTGRFESS